MGGKLARVKKLILGKMVVYFKLGLFKYTNRKFCYFFWNCRIQNSYLIIVDRRVSTEFSDKNYPQITQLSHVNH